MSLNLAGYQKQARSAVEYFWKNRDTAILKQREAGRAGTGQRSAVTAGKNMNGFLVLIADIVRKNGLKNAAVHLGRGVVTLPGFYRPTKQWDMLVMNGPRLIAAIELKSQVGSFGNNFNNRTEEAIGTAVDFSTAYREGALGDQPKPFLGWLMLVEDCPASRKPIRDRSPHFRLFKEFENCSYAERYNLLCQKLIREELYTSATVLLSSKSAVGNGRYSELAELTSLKTFVTSLAGHVAAEAARVP